MEWLSKEVILSVHARQLAEHGGSDGVRDEGLLESAIARPQQLWTYSETEPNVAALAAALAFGITRNHPFVDGNKRTAYVACRLFLKLNGCDIAATSEEKYKTFLSLAEGTLDEAQLVRWLESKLQPPVGDSIQEAAVGYVAS